MLKLGFTSWFSDDINLEDAFHYISDAHCERVEVAGRSEYFSRTASITDSLKQRNLTVTALSAGVPFLKDASLSLHATDQDARMRSVRYVRQCVDFAAALGARIVYVCSIRRNEGAHEAALKLLGDSLGYCSDYAAAAGMTLAIEPFPTGELPSAREAARLIDHLRLKNLGLLLDTGHLVISKEPLPDTARELRNLIVHVHLNNNDGSKDLHWPPQRGKIARNEFEQLLLELHRSGYQGAISAELANPEPIEGVLLDTLVFFDSLVKGSKQSTA